MADFPTVNDLELEGSLHDSDSPHFRRSTGEVWHKSNRMKQTRTLRKALVYQRRLECAAQGLIDLSSSMTMAQLRAPYAASLIRLVTDVTTSSHGLGDFFSDIASTSLHNERRSSTGCPARRVFDVPELLEQILSYLNPMEILQASEINWTSYSTMQASPLLQQILWLRPSVPTFLETPFNSDYDYDSPSPPDREKRDSWQLKPSTHFPGFYCYARMHRGVPDAAAVFAQLSLRLPRIGKRCRSMLVCQPPIYQMEVYPLCCTFNPYYTETAYVLKEPLRPARANHPIRVRRRRVEMREPPFEVVTSATGITVGDLYDMSLKIKETHRLCPWAPSNAHSDRGDVIVHVSFGGPVCLRPDDPAGIWPVPPVPPRGSIALSQYSMHPSLVARIAGQRPDELLSMYVEAKRRAYSNDDDIPTFEEFKAARRRVSA